VTDCSLYTVHQKYLKTNDDEMIINHMKIFFSHLMTAVNQRYMNSFENYTIFSLNTTVKAFLILKVIIKRFSNSLKFFSFYCKNPGDCLWASQELVGSKAVPTKDGVDVIIGEPTLRNFSKFISSKQFNFTFDHAMGLLE
jgi:hypothetical protein